MDEEDKSWREVFDDENRLRVIRKLKKELEVEEWPKSAHDAAVLVPLVMVEGKPSILFTLRSQEVSAHRQLVR